jgi:hypothetical protein
MLATENLRRHAVVSSHGRYTATPGAMAIIGSCATTLKEKSHQSRLYVPRQFFFPGGNTGSENTRGNLGILPFVSRHSPHGIPAKTTEIL